MNDAPDLDRLRDELIAMRAGLVTRLARRIEGGELALLASVGGALATVESMRREVQGAVR